MAWSSKKQSMLALSTTEAEYIAATHCAKQVIWHRFLLNEVGIPLPSTSTIFKPPFLLHTIQNTMCELNTSTSHIISYMILSKMGH